LKYSKAIESHEWEILPTVVALLEIFADVVNFCEKENSCISAAMASAKFIMITLEETDCKGAVELQEALQQNINRRSKTFQFHQKKPAVVCNPAGSKIENGIFSRREADQAELLLVQLVAAARTETIKNKSQKRKESPMEGSRGEAADRKRQKNRQGFCQGYILRVFE